MKQFTNESMLDIMGWIDNELKLIKPKDKIFFEVLSPDINNSLYSGNSILIDNKKYIYHSFKSWVDLSQLYFCKILTPKIVSKNTIIITFEKLDLNNSFHKIKIEDKDIKYGIDSEFSNIIKNEEPSFVYYYKEALKNVNISLIDLLQNNQNSCKIA